MPTIKRLLTTDELNMAQITQWLNDNQLPEGSTFLAPASVGTTSIAAGAVTPLQQASQSLGACQGAPSIPNGASVIAAWTTLVDGTYLTASAGGLTATTDGLYLIRGTIRWDGGTVGQRFHDISINGSGINASGFGGGGTPSALSPTWSITAAVSVASGGVISLNTFNGQGAAVTPLFAHVDAALLFG